MGRLIGIFGGTFDPPHVGHLILAETSLQELGLETVLWVLTPRSPLKPDGDTAAVAVRRRMVQAAIESHSQFRFSSVDVDRQPPYYAVATVEALRAAEPEADFVYLMGSDALEELPRWHEPGRLVDLCAAIGLMDRAGHTPDLSEIDRQVPGVAAKVRPFRVPRIEISASDIRRRVSDGRSIRYLVPDAVRRVIEEEGLYRRQTAS